MCYNPHNNTQLTTILMKTNNGSKNNFERSTGWSVGCREAAGWGGAWCSVSPGVIFYPPSAIDRCGGEGGSSDVSVKAARLRQSPTEPRKEETRNKKGKEVLKAGGQVDRLRRDPRRAHRGRTQGRPAMERSAEEDYKEKLLWNVKREVGEAFAFSITFTGFNLYIFCYKSPENPPKDDRRCYAYAGYF